jgi:hypothetical protein
MHKSHHNLSGAHTSFLVHPTCDRDHPSFPGNLSLVPKKAYLSLSLVVVGTRCNRCLHPSQDDAGGFDPQAPARSDDGWYLLPLFLIPSRVLLGLLPVPAAGNTAATSARPGFVLFALPCRRRASCLPPLSPAASSNVLRRASAGTTRGGDGKGQAKPGGTTLLWLRPSEMASESAFRGAPAPEPVLFRPFGRAPPGAARGAGALPKRPIVVYDMIR